MQITHLTPALILAATVMASPTLAETDPTGPRILTLSQTTTAILPGDVAGARHGVKVNRGSGFPEPVVVELQQIEETAEPAPAPRRVLRRVPRW